MSTPVAMKVSMAVICEMTEPLRRFMEDTHDSFGRITDDAFEFIRGYTVTLVDMIFASHESVRAECTSAMSKAELLESLPTLPTIYRTPAPSEHDGRIAVSPSWLVNRARVLGQLQAAVKAIVDGIPLVVIDYFFRDWYNPLYSEGYSAISTPIKLYLRAEDVDITTPHTKHLVYN